MIINGGLNVTCVCVCAQHGEARRGPPPVIMCTRPYPDCSVFRASGRDAECDMDSAAENGAGSDSSDGGRGDR